MATQSVRADLPERKVPWRTILLSAFGIFFILFLALPLLNIFREMFADPLLLARQLVIGLTNGAYIALIALGYTMVYGIVELINFAHGDLYMLGAFFALTMIGVFNLTASTPVGVRIPLLLVALVLTMLFTAAVNVTIDRFVYRRLRGGSRLAALISAVGLSFVFQNLGLLWGYLRFPALNGVMGSNAVAPKNVEPLIPNINLTQGIVAIRFTLRDLVILVVALVLMTGLYLFVQRTRLGKAMRATAQDRDASSLMGINVNQTIAMAFLIGGAMAGAAGMMAGQYNGTVVFDMGFKAGLYSFTAAVLGGIGNILGAMLGGILIGLIAAISDQYISAKWTDAVIFAILVIVLVFRPTGLLGENVQQKA